MAGEPDWSAESNGNPAPGAEEYEIEIEEVQRTRPRRRGLLLVFGRLLWGTGPEQRSVVQIVSAGGSVTQARAVSFGVFAKPPQEGPHRIHLVLGEVTWEGLRAGDRIREPGE